MLPMAQSALVGAHGRAENHTPNELYIRVGLRWAALAIIAIRSICDPVFQRSEFEGLGDTIGPGAILNAVVIAIAMVFLISRPAFLMSTISLVWAFFLLIAFVSILSSPQFVSAARIFLVILSYWAFFVIPFFILRTRSDLALFLLIVFASSVAPLTYGLFEVAYELSKGGDFRIQSTFTHANIFAFYLVLLLALVLFVQVSCGLAWSTRQRRSFLLLIPLLVFLLVMTKTRSAWVAATVIFFVYAIWLDRRLLLLLFLTPLVILDPTIYDRLADLQSGAEIEDLSQLNAETRLNSFAWREVLWSSATPWILENPIWGYGLESFRFYSPDFFPLSIDGAGIDSHSLFVQIQFEMGLVGIVAFMFLICGIAGQLVSGMRHDRSGMIVLCGLLLVYLVESYSDNMIYYLAYNWYFYFVMGTACAWIRFQKSLHKSHALHARLKRNSTIQPPGISAIGGRIRSTR